MGRADSRLSPQKKRNISQAKKKARHARAKVEHRPTNPRVRLETAVPLTPLARTATETSDLPAETEGASAAVEVAG